MIAKWIAQALMRGDDHLTLTIEELAKWQANGCRFGFGAPYGQFGSYAVAQVYQWAKELENLLLQQDPCNWPVGEVELKAHGNRRSAWMPAHEFQRTEAGLWRVPLIPVDSNHHLDGWAYDIYLSPEELSALKPIARQLSERCQRRCEIKSADNPRRKAHFWNEGRVALAQIGANELNPSAYEVEIIESERERKTYEYQINVLEQRRLISKDSRYAHELQIKPKGDSYNLKIFSSLLSSWPHCEGLTKLELELSRYELVKLKSMIEDSLGLPPLPIHEGADLAAEVMKHHDRMNTRHAL